MKIIDCKDTNFNDLFIICDEFPNIVTFLESLDVKLKYFWKFTKSFYVRIVYSNT